MNNYDSGVSNAALAGMMALISAMLIPLIILGLFLIVCQWMVYTKAGKPGWACIIPIYNYIVLLQIVGKPWWWILLMLIPFVNVVLAIIVLHRLSKSFGKGAGFTLGLIFLPFIFYPILAFGSAKYTPLTDMPMGTGGGGD